MDTVELYAHRRRLAGAVAAALLTALAAAPALAVEIRTIEVGGAPREVCVHEPATYAGGAPVLIFFHGGGGHCTDPYLVKIAASADAAGVLLVMPNGIGGIWDAAGAQSADLALFDALVGLVDAEFAPGRLFVAGVSRGGMMVYHLACHRAGAIDGAAVIMGTRLSATCPGGPVPFLHLHGLYDGVVPFGGGGPSGYPPVEPAMLDQAADNGCIGDWTAATNAAGASVVTYPAGCATATELWLYACQHGVPGFPPSGTWWAWLLGFGCTQAFRAEDVMMAFFEAVP